jgi:hypothetical protein
MRKQKLNSSLRVGCNLHYGIHLLIGANERTLMYCDRMTGSESQSNGLKAVECAVAISFGSSRLVNVSVI